MGRGHWWTIVYRVTNRHDWSNFTHVRRTLTTTKKASYLTNKISLFEISRGIKISNMQTLMNHRWVWGDSGKVSFFQVFGGNQEGYGGSCWLQAVGGWAEGDFLMNQKEIFLSAGVSRQLWVIEVWDLPDSILNGFLYFHKCRSTTPDCGGKRKYFKSTSLLLIS